MRINNFTELSNFLNSNGLTNLGGKLLHCLKEYDVACTCKPKEKSDKLEECTRYYTDTINNLVNNKHRVFNTIKTSKLEFFKNGQLVSTISR